MDIGIGRLLSGNAQRDAVHVAVAPVVAGEDLVPGQKIGFLIAGDIRIVGVVKLPIGVVDPFLDQPVRKGDEFWMFLYPGTITSLRHDWVHPAFSVPQITQDGPSLSSEAAGATVWLEDYADELGITYDTLMNAAGRYLKSGTYYYGTEDFEGVYLDKRFWEYYALATGYTVPIEHQDNFFRCAC